MGKFDNSTSTEGAACTPCKAKQKKLSVLVGVNQFRQSNAEWTTNAFSSIKEILKTKASFTEIQIDTIIESIKTTPVENQLIYIGAESDAIAIYNALLNSGIEPKVSGNSIQKF